MIAPFSQLLADARERRAAVGAFTCYDVTTALGVLQAADARQTATILLVSEASFRRPYGPRLVSALATVAAEAGTPCCVQLDHASNPALIRRGVDAGAGAAMADGSRRPAAENAELIARVRAAVGESTGIEAELGHIEGGEDVTAEAALGELTDPNEAERFVAAVRPDCLAISIGNIHGAYASKPTLDWERLSRIVERTDGVPLSLHGASGLEDVEIQRAVALGIRKVNINTELRGRYFRELEDRVPDARQGYRLLELQDALIGAVAEVVTAKLALLEV